MGWIPFGEPRLAGAGIGWVSRVQAEPAAASRLLAQQSHLAAVLTRSQLTLAMLLSRPPLSDCRRMHADELRLKYALAQEVGGTE